MSDDFDATMTIGLDDTTADIVEANAELLGVGADDYGLAAVLLLNAIMTEVGRDAGAMAALKVVAGALARGEGGDVPPMSGTNGFLGRVCQRVLDRLDEREQVDEV